MCRCVPAGLDLVRPAAWGSGIALSPDGARLYVTHFLTGQVSVIDTAQLAVAAVISTGADSNMAQRIVLNSGRAYLPHIRSNTLNRFLLFDNAVFPPISVIDLVAQQAVPRERIDLSLGAVPVVVSVGETSSNRASVEIR